MKQLAVAKFQNFEEEAEFWDNLDTADLMEVTDRQVFFLKHLHATLSQTETRFRTQ